MPPGGYGAHHGCELWYAFDTLSAAPWQARAADCELADAMSSAWVAFARSGDPNVSVLPRWPSFGATGQAMLLSEHPHVATPFNASALEFFDRRFAALAP
jgi:para-nitrobenzyl esterase